MSTDDLDTGLDTRLATLEANVPVDTGPPPLAEPRRRRRSALALVAAPILVLAIGATAIAGVGVIQMITTSSSTLDIDDDLAKAGLECMTPPQAAKWLADHGYKDVVWDTGAGNGTIQVGDSASALPVIDPNASLPAPSAGIEGGLGAAPPGVERTTTPPAEGVAYPGPTIDGTLIMFVDTSPGAERPPTCPAASMP